MCLCRLLGQRLDASGSTQRTDAAISVCADSATSPSPVVLDYRRRGSTCRAPARRHHSPGTSTGKTCLSGSPGLGGTTHLQGRVSRAWAAPVQHDHLQGSSKRRPTLHYPTHSLLCHSDARTANLALLMFPRDMLTRPVQKCSTVRDSSSETFTHKYFSTTRWG